VDPNTSRAPAPGPESLLPPPHADQELVAAILRKDRKAAAHFVAAHIDAVYAYARHRLTPREDLVEDVVQDVFLAALNGLATFQGQSSLRGWVIGIARHKVEDLYRRLLRAPEAIEAIARDDEQQLSEAPALEERLDALRTREKARQILARIPERYGLVLLWRYWEQRSVREIASAIGTTEKSVERMLARARQRFKQAWLEREREAP
jgi:RNA polymerase sigma-70 factor, ECF subfamily